MFEKTPEIQFSQNSAPTDSELQHLDFATERAAILLGSYRKGEANDPARYSTAVSAVLAQYSQNVIYEVTNPLTGLPSRTDFMPTLKELRHACELEAQRENRINNSKPLRSLPKYESKPDLKRPSYEDLLKKHGRPVGAFEQPNDGWNKLGGKRHFDYGTGG